MKELNFYNIRVIYDGTKINRKTIFINNCIMYLIIILLFVLIAALGFQLPEHLVNSTLGAVLCSVGMVVILLIGAGIIYFILNRISPRHYEFVTWLMQFKYDDLEFGFFNDRYMVEIFESGERKTRNLGYFITEDFTMHENNVDISKSLHLTIDCTRDEIQAIVSNE